MEQNFKDKSYRIIKINNKTYKGKDSFKNRTSDYIINAFDENYFDNKIILDLGSASGAILFQVMNKIKKGVGVDVDSKKLNIGRHIIRENEIQNISLHEARIENFIHKTEESYDCIFLLNILHHVQSPYGILNVVAELSDDMICIEAPEEGFYNAYDRDIGKEVNFDRLDVQDIVNFLKERNYDLIKKQESENQDSFQGPKRCVCLFKKRKISFNDISDVRKINKGMVIGPGASGKTRFLHEFYNLPVEYKALNIIKNNVFNEEGKSLKFGKNITSFSEEFPIIYIAPNYKSIEGYRPNIDEWIGALKKTRACGIVCYIKPCTHKERLLNRIENKKTKNARQHLDNYPFSYQNLFYKLEKNGIEYFVIDTTGK